MLWALQHQDPQHWLSPDANVLQHWLTQIERNDGNFKHHLDR